MNLPKFVVSNKSLQEVRSDLAVIFVTLEEIIQYQLANWSCRSFIDRAHKFDIIVSKTINRYLAVLVSVYGAIPQGLQQVELTNNLPFVVFRS